VEFESHFVPDNIMAYRGRLFCGFKILCEVPCIHCCKSLAKPLQILRSYIIYAVSVAILLKPQIILTPIARFEKFSFARVPLV